MVDEIDWEALERKLNRRDYYREHSLARRSDIIKGVYEVWRMVKRKDSTLEAFMEFAKNEERTTGKKIERDVANAILSENYGKRLIEENGKLKAIEV